MSFFGKDVHPLLESGVDYSAADEILDVEVEDGVVVERRSVLWLSAAAVASVLTGGSLPARDNQGRQEKDKPDPRSFAGFLAAAYPKARGVVASGGKDEEAYLHSVAAALSRVAKPGGEIRKDMRAFMQQHRKEGERFPISVAAMRLRPGRGFAHHDHRDYNGVILGVEGEVRIRNFDILGDNPVPPKGKTFQIRETRDDLILPGRFSTLGQTRENVHELVAGPDGARVLDVFTFFKRGARSVMMKVEAKPRDEKKRIWDAAWR